MCLEAFLFRKTLTLNTVDDTKVQVFSNNGHTVASQPEATHAMLTFSQVFLSLICTAAPWVPFPPPPSPAELTHFFCFGVALVHTVAFFWRTRFQTANVD